MTAITPLPSTAEKMEIVKSACDAAPAGPKKHAALEHYQAATRARSLKDDAACDRALDAAKHALV